MLEAMKLSEVANALSARLLTADASFNGVSIDSRAIQPGQLACLPFQAVSQKYIRGWTSLKFIAAVADISVINRSASA